MKKLERILCDVCGRRIGWADDVLQGINTAVYCEDCEQKENE